MFAVGLAAATEVSIGRPVSLVGEARTAKMPGWRARPASSMCAPGLSSRD
jgi:hypothetical protein